MDNTTDIFLDIKSLAARTCICQRNWRASIKDKTHPLPYYRVGGKILVYWPEVVEWMQQFRKLQPVEKSRVDALVDELIQ